MYTTFISSEVKKWLRDPLMKFMLFYPLAFGLIGRYLLPWIADASSFSIDAYADVIVVALTLMTPQIFGALVGFSILEDRDDNLLTAVRVTPLSIHQFLSFRMVLVFLLSFLATAFVMLFSDIGGLALTEVFVISFIASLSAPLTGLLINAFAQNKIEGFAVMKGTGTLLIFPVISLFFLDKKELFFSFAPGFWPAKMISSAIRGENVLLLSYSQYLWIGLAYVIVLNYLIYQLFLRKTSV